MTDIDYRELFMFSGKDPNAPVSPDVGTVKVENGRYFLWFEKKDDTCTIRYWQEARVTAWNDWVAAKDGFTDYNGPTIPAEMHQKLNDAAGRTGKTVTVDLSGMNKVQYPGGSGGGSSGSWGIVSPGPGVNGPINVPVGGTGATPLDIDEAIVQAYNEFVRKFNHP